MDPNTAHPLQCWNSEAVDRFFTVEATEKKDVFSQTHLPIDRIRVEHYVRSNPRKGDDIDELTFRNMIIRSTASPETGNRVFWLRGESGCGKSELCQWLALNVNDGVHVPVYIPRETVRPVKIYETLAQHLGENVDGMVDITQLDPVTFVYALLAPITKEINFTRDPMIAVNRKILLAYLGKPAFQDRIRENFNKYRQEITRIELNKAYADAKALHLLTLEQFEHLVPNLKDPLHCYTFVLAIIERVITEDMHAGGTIDEKLEALSKAFVNKGLRPVLIIEDITSTGFLKTGILRFLLSKNAGHFDAVVGVTTGYHRDHEREIFGESADTILARLEGLLNMTDDNLTTLFLREGRHVDLAQRYLMAVKEGKCETCPQQKQCYAAFGEGLYPFNEAFLDKIYAGLQEQDVRGAVVTKRTPRLYLREGLMRVLQSDLTLDLPAATAERLSIKAPVEQFTPSQDWAHLKEFRQALKWYGEYDKDSKVTRISESLLAMLGVEVPAGLAREGGHIVVNAQPASTELQDFRQWLEMGGKYPTYQVLETGVRTALKLFDLEQLEVRNSRTTISQYAALSYQIKTLGSVIPIAIEGATASDAVALTVPRQATLLEVLSSLWALGAKPTQGGKQPHDPSINLVAVETWVRRAYRDSERAFRGRLQKLLRMSPEHFVLTAWSLLKNLLEGVNESTDPQFVALLPLGVPALFPQIKDPTAARAKLAARAELFNLLFQGMFYLRTSVIDRPALDAALQDFDLLECIKQLRAIKADELSRVRFTGSSKVTGLEIGDVIRDLIQYTTGDFFVRMDYKSQAASMAGKVKSLVQVQADLPDNLVDLLELVGRALEAYKKLRVPLNLPWEADWESRMRRFQENNMQLGALRERLTALGAWSSTLVESNVVSYFNLTKLLLLHHLITQAPQIGLLEFADRLTAAADQQIKGPGQQDLTGSSVHTTYSQHLANLLQELEKEVSA